MDGQLPAGFQDLLDFGLLEASDAAPVVSSWVLRFPMASSRTDRVMMRSPSRSWKRSAGRGWPIRVCRYWCWTRLFAEGRTDGVHQG
jgi:hypothetical protein